MNRKSKQVTITVHEEILSSFKEYCDTQHLPMSRFLAMAGREKIAREKGGVSNE